MGTDINLLIQKQNKTTGDWEDINNDKFRPHRNYNAFAVIADVRNGYGFGGMETSSGFNPISTPRGLPEDFDSDSEVTEGSWGYHVEPGHFNGDHSVSWLGYRELADYDYSQKIIHYGVIPFYHWLLFRKHVPAINPLEIAEIGFYSGDSYRPNGITVNQETAEVLLEQYGSGVDEFAIYIKDSNVKFSLGDKEYYFNASFVRVSWEETYEQSVGGWINSLLEEMRDYSDVADHSDMRIVFGFDC